METIFLKSLKAIFNRAESTDHSETGIICEELNDWQYQAVENSNQSIVSIISGPARYWKVIYHSQHSS